MGKQICKMRKAELKWKISLKQNDIRNSATQKWGEKVYKSCNFSH